MKIKLSNVGESRIAIVAEPEAQEVGLSKGEILVINIQNPASDDIELVYGDMIISVYIPDCDGYKFDKYC